jgi:DNA adenine methylase
LTVAEDTLSRPVLRYHGGKWKLAPWVLSFFPAHRIYVEPFGGGAAVMLRKERAYGEVYNDLESEVVNVFRVLQDPAKAEQLSRLVALTPYARQEFNDAYEEPASDIERAHHMLVRSFMGFGSASMTRTHKTGFRSNSNRSGTIPAQDWANWPWQIQHFTARLRGVVIENRHAFDVIRQHDREDTLFYLDPPYPWGTRSSMGRAHTHYYKHEMTDEDHAELAELLHGIKGMAIISGYPCELYERDLYPDWHSYRRKHHADGARERTEVIWVNDAAAAALDGGLFGHAEDDEASGTTVG